MKQEEIDGVLYYVDDEGEPIGRVPQNTQNVVVGGPSPVPNVPGERDARAVARAVRGEGVTLPDGTEITLDDYEHASMVVRTWAAATKHRQSKAYVEARLRKDADAALAVWELTDQEARAALGWPTTYAEFDRTWGQPEGWASARVKTKDFRRSHVTNGYVLNRASQDFETVYENMIRRTGMANAPASLFSTFFKVMGLFQDSDTAKDGAERDDFEEMTAEQKALSMIRHIQETPRFRAEVVRLGDGEEVEAHLRDLFLTVIAQMLDGRVDQGTQKKRKRKLLKAAQGDSTEYVPPPPFGEHYDADGNPLGAIEDAVVL